MNKWDKWDAWQPLDTSTLDPEVVAHLRAQTKVQKSDDDVWLCLHCRTPLGADDVALCEIHEPLRLKQAREKRLERLKSEQNRVNLALDFVLPPFPHAIIGGDEYKAAVHPSLVTATWQELSLAVFGPTGTGKTTFVIAALRELARQRLREWAKHLKSYESHCSKTPQVVWTTGHELAAAPQRSPLGSEPKAITDAIAAEILVIDELGYEPRAPHILEIINRRYAVSKPTLVTSGLTPEQFIDPSRYGAACYRRLVEAGRGQEINLFDSEANA